MKLRLTALAIFVLCAFSCTSARVVFSLEGLSSPVGQARFGGQYLGERTGSEDKRLLQEGPIDEEQYHLGPGDVLGVDIWGATSIQFRLDVDAEGKVFVPDCGSLTVGGLRLSEARELVKSTVLSSMRQGRVEVRLLVLRKFKVYVAGEVDRPGSYMASATTRVSELLDASRRDTLVAGLKETSSLRNIQLRRRDGESARADLMLFYLAGDPVYNPPVTDGDVIYVPRVERTFSVSGGVMFPGTYELVAGETVSGALRLVGGVTPDADLERGEIRRFVANDQTESTYFELRKIIAGELDFEIQEGDRIYVRTPTHYLERHNVYVGGEVELPGWYAITPREDRLSDVIERAGGLTAEADVNAARVLRPDSLGSEERHAVDIDFAKLIAGGKTEPDIMLESGDVIEIPRKAQYVLVSGEVRRPGYVRYVPGKRVSYYIREAGGFTRRAAGSKTLVTRHSTGQSLLKTETGIIYARDKIAVPERPDGATWMFVKDTVTLLAQLATIYLVMDQAVGK